MQQSLRRRFAGAKPVRLYEQSLRRRFAGAKPVRLYVIGGMILAAGLVTNAKTQKYRDGITAQQQQRRLPRLNK